MSTTITATVRAAVGKGGARQTRHAGLLPGIIYGAVDAPVAVSLPARAFSQLIAKEGESGLIDLKVEDATGKGVLERKAIIRQIDYHPLKEVPIHVDFMAVAMDRKLTISVPVELTGEPKGVTVSKGIMSQVTYEVEVECLPDRIPHSILVDVSLLDIGDSIHVKDLEEIENVRVLTGGDHTVVTVEAPRVEEEAVAAEEEAAEEAAEPEVITKGKEETEAGSGS